MDGAGGDMLYRIAMRYDRLSTQKGHRMRYRILGAFLLIALQAWTNGIAAAMGARSICESFEKAETDRLERQCSGKDWQDPVIMAQVEAANRANAQCRELLSASLSLRRVKVNPSGLQKCLKARTAYLADPARSQAAAASMRTACNLALRGERKAGQTCDSAFECVSGLVCVGKHGGPPGVCRQPLALGASCDDDPMNASQLHALLLAVRNVCGPGAHCGRKNGSLVCRANVKRGQACEGQSRLECGLASRCSAGVCVAETLGGDGAACKQIEDCRDGYYCSPRYRCKARLSAGTSCDLELECKGLCRAGTCQARCGSG